MVSFFFCWMFQFKQIKKFHISQAIIKTQALRLSEKKFAHFFEHRMNLSISFFPFSFIVFKLGKYRMFSRIQYRRIVVRTARHIILLTFSPCAQSDLCFSVYPFEFGIVCQILENWISYCVGFFVCRCIYR